MGSCRVWVYYWALEYAADYDCVHSQTPAVLRVVRPVLSTSLFLSLSLEMSIDK